jgi:hypothetical protein
MIRFGVLLVCMVGLGIGAGAAATLRRSKPSPIAQASAFRVSPDTGVQEVAVFIGATWCAASAFPGLKDSLPILMKQLKAEARSRNHWFSSIGVSLDAPPQKGIDWLSKYGPFDELIVGGGWANYGVLSLIWSDPSSPADLPQLIILTRPIVAASPRMRLGPTTVRERLYGSKPILSRLVSQ